MLSCDHILESKSDSDEHKYSYETTLEVKDDQATYEARSYSYETLESTDTGIERKHKGYSDPKSYETSRSAEEAYGPYEKEYEDISLDNSMPKYPNKPCYSCSDQIDLLRNQMPIDCLWGPWQGSGCNRKCGKGRSKKIREKLKVEIRREFRT